MNETPRRRSDATRDAILTAARERFAAVPQAEVVAVEGAKHLFVGFTERVLDEVVRRVNPSASPLPATYEESA